MVKNQQGSRGKILVTAVAIIVLIGGAVAFWQSRTEGNVVTAPTTFTEAELTAVVETAPLPQIAEELINCSNWLSMEEIAPGMIIEGPAAIYPFAVPRELAATLGVKWREGWGYNILAEQTVVIPETIVDVTTGEEITPRGVIRMFDNNEDLRIAEFSNFNEACR